MNFSDTTIETGTRNHIINMLPHIGRDQVIDDILQGLQAPQPHVSSMFFYDEAGSALFEKITALEEYYPTRTEKQLLPQAARHLIEKLDQIELVELGSGDCSKIRLILSQIPPDRLSDVRYIAVDVSHSVLEESAAQLESLYPDVHVQGIAADFISQIAQLPAGTQRRLYCFFGSTLGNLTRTQSRQFFRDISSIMRPGDGFLLGVDRIKDISIIERAYNDSKGITALFNLNILKVVNNITLTDFNPHMWEHLAFYNTELDRIEMHLRAMTSQSINSPYLKSPLLFKKGDTIHTENSHKFSNEFIRELASNTGLTLEQHYSDEQEWFSLFHLTK